VIAALERGHQKCDMFESRSFGTFGVFVLITVGCGGSVAPEPASEPIADSALETSADTRVESDSGTTLADTTETEVEGPRVIRCGTSTCDAATEVCCTAPGGGTCVAKGVCTSGGVLACSGSSSCPGGQVCCGSNPMSSSCKTSCTEGVTFCDTSDECPSGTTCVKTMMGWKICTAKK